MGQLPCPHCGRETRQRRRISRSRKIRKWLLSRMMDVWVTPVHFSFGPYSFQRSVGQLVLRLTVGTVVSSCLGFVVRHVHFF
jgi:hypothetical protein